jgi:hypothetical protein
VPAAQNVDVKMWNTLAGCVAGVDHDAVPALGDVHLIGDLSSRIKKLSQQREVQLGCVVERLEIVLTGNQKHVHGRLRIGIFDSNHLIVVIHDFARKVSAYDATEDATLFHVFHIRNRRGNYQPGIVIQSNKLVVLFVPGRSINVN